MSLAAVNEAVIIMNGIRHPFTEEEKEFVVQFAFKSGCREKTNLLIDELAHSNNKRASNEVMARYTLFLQHKAFYYAGCPNGYQDKCGAHPAWVEEAENLLVALEVYRIQQEKAINRLAGILFKYGIDVSAEEILLTGTKELKNKIRKESEAR